MVLRDENGIYAGPKAWQKKLFVIIFKADTTAGKWFDIFLLFAIMLSVLVVMMESIPGIRLQYFGLLKVLEWVFTIGFTIEYLLRILIVRKSKNYILSTLGIIDLIAIIPTYLSLFFIGSQYFVVVRALRLLRVFRILKLAHYLVEIQQLSTALLKSLRKIGVFMLSVLLLVIILGSFMYVIEGGENGFDSIPMSIYWAVITITTVGYGDIVPVTNLGKGMATMMMLIGYSIIAIPTGIVSVELGKATGFLPRQKSKISCPRCKENQHLEPVHYCHRCGFELDKGG